MNYNQISALTVEDDLGGGTLITMILRRLGINALVDAQGINTLEVAHSMSPTPSVIFLDLNLPRTSGFEIIKAIRDDETLRDTKVVAVTAMDANTMLPRCREAGFDGYIRKPIRRDRFIQQVHQILDGQPVWEVR